MGKYKKAATYAETDESEDSESNNSENSTENNSKQLWCICRSSDGSRFMICCDKCEEWYHGDCINITPKEAEFIIKYYCAQCEKREPILKSVYKSGAPIRKGLTTQPGKNAKGKSETIFLKTGATDRNKIENEKKTLKSNEKISTESQSIENRNKSEQVNKQLNMEKHQNPISTEMRIKSEKVQPIKPFNKNNEIITTKPQNPISKEIRTKSEKVRSIKPDSKFNEMIETKPQNAIAKEMQIKSEKVQQIKPASKFMETIEITQNNSPIAKEMRTKSEKVRSIKPDSKFIEGLELKTTKIQKMKSQDKLPASAVMCTNESNSTKIIPKDTGKLKIQPKIKAEEKIGESKNKIIKDARKCMDCTNCLRKSDCNACINCKTNLSQGCLKRFCVKTKKIPENIVKTEKLTLTKLPGEFIPKKVLPPAPKKHQQNRELVVKKESTCQPSSPVNVHENSIKRLYSSSISSKSSTCYSMNADKNAPISNKLPLKNPSEIKSKQNSSSESGSNSTKTNDWIDNQPVRKRLENRQKLLKRPLTPSRSSEDSYISSKKTKISNKTLPLKTERKIKLEPEVKNVRKRKLEPADKSQSSTSDFSESDGESVETFNKKKEMVMKQPQKPSVRKGKQPKKLPVKPEEKNLMKEVILGPCRNIGCKFLRNFGSKYCSDECGIQLAHRILLMTLPERIEEYNRTESYADMKDMERKAEIDEECRKIEERLINHDKANAKLARLTYHRRLTSDARDFQNLEVHVPLNHPAEVRCPTCDDFVSVGRAVNHMQICFQKIENRTMIFADYKEQLMGSKLFCDFYDPSVEGYCKRLDALCDHNKDDSNMKVGPEIICAYPLTENNEANIVCLTAKLDCSKHVNWERTQRAVIDMRRYRLLVKMEELKNEEINIERALFQRRSVMNLLLHRTVDHQPNRPMF